MTCGARKVLMPLCEGPCGLAATDAATDAAASAAAAAMADLSDAGAPGEDNTIGMFDCEGMLRD